MFQVKICGITSLADARIAVEAGADAIGLNFYPKSTRYVKPEVARDICQHMDGLTTVAVFVNETAQQIRQQAETIGFTMAQLHGDEPPEILLELNGLRIIRACRCPNADLDKVQAYWRECQAQDASPEGLLLDAYQPGQYGGTGTALDWHALRTTPPTAEGVPWILAGGLTPENVTEAISLARPHGVDVAGGVEHAPGLKDPVRLREFVQAAQGALQRLEAEKS